MRWLVVALAGVALAYVSYVCGMLRQLRRSALEERERMERRRRYGG